jgi:hypothetical protein
VLTRHHVSPHMNIKPNRKLAIAYVSSADEHITLSEFESVALEKQAEFLKRGIQGTLLCSDGNLISYIYGLENDVRPMYSDICGEKFQKNIIEMIRETPSYIDSDNTVMWAFRTGARDWYSTDTIRNQLLGEISKPSIYLTLIRNFWHNTKLGSSIRNEDGDRF